MQLEKLQQHWNSFAKTDPFWAILTAPDKKNGGWTADQFFETGRLEIDALMKSAAALNWPGRRQRALDFGCGVGRLTQALCQHFAECSGVDISVEMLHHAQTFNQYKPRCSYHLNTTNDLSLFPDSSFDFIYSNIVLQHMQPDYAANYIREFLRILAPGGLIVFQLPSELIRHADVSEAGALPGSAFRASIQIDAATARMSPSSEAQVTVVVRNLSNVPWPRSSVRLGNHWFSESGAVIAFDDGRAELSNDLAPSADERITLCVTAPKEPGTYQLELDMVQEGISWFKDQGSETRIVSVDVHPVASTEMEQPTFKARMEMYGTPLETVVAIVSGAGGRFVEIKEDTCAGLDWRSYRYCITKDPPAASEAPDRYYFREYEV